MNETCLFYMGLSIGLLIGGGHAYYQMEAWRCVCNRLIEKNNRLCAERDGLKKEKDGSDSDCTAASDIQVQG